MTDREILERARQICHERGWPHVAGEIRRVCGIVTEPDPAADCVEVRIAVAMDEDGFHESCVFRDPSDDRKILDCCREDMDFEVTHEAIITARIPRRTVPVVEGKVEAVA